MSNPKLCVAVLNAPVAFFVFNRPELTARVFERIRQARPARLLVVCDGPRPDRPDDADKVAAVRAIVEEVDWPCEVRRNYAESNMGCRLRVASGLNWVFEQVEEAIILEDDTLPDPSFFAFCQELLERYRDDPKVMHIAGTNLAPGHCHGASYRFSHHPWIWGWATWRRAWGKYDFAMNTWDERQRALRASFATSWEAQYWTSTFHQTRGNLAKANTWDFPWMYSVRSLLGLCLLPCVNLVENIGIGKDATHTQEDAAHLRRPARSLSLPLRHPAQFSLNRFADDNFTRSYNQLNGFRYFILSWTRVILQKVRAVH